MTRENKFILWLMLIIMIMGIMCFFMGIVICSYYQTKNPPEDSEKFLEQPKVESMIN